jgi:hypothetical protein
MVVEDRITTREEVMDGNMESQEVTLTAVCCPNCGADTIRIVKYDGSAMECWEVCVCDDCYHEWTNIYKLVAQVTDAEEKSHPDTPSWVRPSDFDAETLITLSADLAEHSDLFESFPYYVNWIKKLTREFTDRYKDRTVDDWQAKDDYWERLEEFEDEAVAREVKKAIDEFDVYRKRECNWDIIREGDNHAC